jgi:hypothetical protein
VFPPIYRQSSIWWFWSRLSFVNEVAPSDFLKLTNAPVTESVEHVEHVEHVAAATFITGKTNETKSKEPVPLTPPVPELAPSKNIFVLTDLLTTAASAVEPKETNKIDGVAKLAPSVTETGPPEDVSKPFKPYLTLPNFINLEHQRLLVMPPTTPPVYETAPSDIPNPDAPVTASVASPTGTMLPVSETASSAAAIDKPPNPILEPSEELRFSHNILEVTLKMANPTEPRICFKVGTIADVMQCYMYERNHPLSQMIGCEVYGILGPKEAG